MNFSSLVKEAMESVQKALLGHAPPDDSQPTMRVDIVVGVTFIVIVTGILFHLYLVTVECYPFMILFHFCRLQVLSTLVFKPSMAEGCHLQKCRSSCRLIEKEFSLHQKCSRDMER